MYTWMLASKGVDPEMDYRLMGLRGPMSQLAILTQDGQLGVLIKGGHILNALAEGAVDSRIGELRSEFVAEGAVAIRVDGKGAHAFTQEQIDMLKRDVLEPWILQRRAGASWIGVSAASKWWKFSELFHVIAPDCELRETQRHVAGREAYTWWEVKRAGVPVAWEPDMSAWLPTMDGGTTVLGDQLVIDDGAHSGGAVAAVTGLSPVEQAKMDFAVTMVKAIFGK